MGCGASAHDVPAAAEPRNYRTGRTNFKNIVPGATMASSGNHAPFFAFGSSMLKADAPPPGTPPANLPGTESRGALSAHIDAMDAASNASQHSPAPASDAVGPQSRTASGEVPHPELERQSSLPERRNSSDRDGPSSMGRSGGGGRGGRHSVHGAGVLTGVPESMAMSASAVASSAMLTQIVTSLTAGVTSTGSVGGISGRALSPGSNPSGRGRPGMPQSHSAGDALSSFSASVVDSAFGDAVHGGSVSSQSHQSHLSAQSQSIATNSTPLSQGSSRSSVLPQTAAAVPSAAPFDVSRYEQRDKERLAAAAAAARVGVLPPSAHRLARRGGGGSEPAMKRATTGVVDAQGRIQWTPGELLGKGAYGRVYLGLNTLSGDLMAVKVLDFGMNQGMGEAGGGDRFGFNIGAGPGAAALPGMGGAKASEAAATAESKVAKWLSELEPEIAMCRKLKHRNIVRYLGVQQDDPTNVVSPVLLIFMEFIPGGSIATMVEKFGPLSEDVARRYTRQLLEGLAYLHGFNIIHRDLKGANVLVSRTGVIKLADFGAAVQIQQGPDKAAAMKDSIGARSMRGSVYWMAPEVLSGALYGRRADIWSLGCTLVEMLTGDPPWTELAASAANPWAAAILISKQIEAGCGPALPADLSPLAADFLAKCFQVDPTKRATAEELLGHAFVDVTEDDEGEVTGHEYEPMINPDNWPLGGTAAADGAAPGRPASNDGGGTARSGTSGR